MNASKRLSVAAVVAALALLGAALFGGVADAAKKKKSKTFNGTKTVNAPVPDASPDPPVGTGLFGSLKSTINVPKKRFKGKTVAFSTVKVTVSTVGASADAAEDMNFFLSAPNGRTVGLGTSDFVGQNIGPLTFTPNSPFLQCDEVSDPCGNPNRTVRPPYVGTVGDTSLALYGGIPMAGNWTLEVLDSGTLPGNTNTLGSWKLSVKPAATSATK